jgi:Transposase DDE domain
MENQPMLDQLRRVMFRWRLSPDRAIADTTYGTVENIVALEDMGIRAYFPLPDFDERTEYWGASHFTYDPDSDAYHCPQGESLRRKTATYTEGKIVYRGNRDTCNSCPVKAACTGSENGRIIHRSLYEEYLDRIRGYHQTRLYQKAMRKRRVWVEPLFAEAKQWHGLRQFRLRGLRKVNMKGLRIAASQNLKRWLQATGRGKRQMPGGAAVAPLRVILSTDRVQRRAPAAPDGSGIDRISPGSTFRDPSEPFYQHAAVIMRSTIPRMAHCGQ